MKDRVILRDETAVLVESLLASLQSCSDLEIRKELSQKLVQTLEELESLIEKTAPMLVH
ncbi:MAG: hypothetical protein K1Y36_08165 [Blastocatellia bacterium]|nr:hypothetical protein [Blastocatellia bacterium]